MKLKKVIKKLAMHGRIVITDGTRETNCGSLRVWDVSVKDTLGNVKAGAFSFPSLKAAMLDALSQVKSSD